VSPLLLLSVPQLHDDRDRHKVAKNWNLCAESAIHFQHFDLHEVPGLEELHLTELFHSIWLLLANHSGLAEWL
jgi:hypothetical protein